MLTPASFQWCGGHFCRGYHFLLLRCLSSERICDKPFLFSVRVDQAGVICKQEGFFRVNCMDCLDRTNVVQAAVARVVMEQQVGSAEEKCKTGFNVEPLLYRYTTLYLFHILLHHCTLN